MSSCFDKCCFGLLGDSCGGLSGVAFKQGGFQQFNFDHGFFLKLFLDFFEQFRCGAVFAYQYGWVRIGQLTFDVAFLPMCDFAHCLVFASFLSASGMRVRWPQLRHVMTMCGSLRCLVRTQQFTPGRIRFLQCLHIRRLYCFGSLSFAAMAILRAVFT